ncbi:MAG: Ldh family oxidoreductase [Actinomycetia bacterium]|nr:Ldh family oxidoreductase [Actinomycetes bacterium]
MPKTLRFKKEDLVGYTIKFMEKLGVPASDAAIVADILIEADLRGVSSHGLIRLSTYYGSRLKKEYMNPATPTKVTNESDTTISFDGANGLGQVNGYRAMAACIEKAEKSNIAVATVNRSNHYGIAAYYAMMALDSDMIGISMTNSQPLTAPTYGSTAVLGTNPIAVAAPSYKKYPYVLDMATSVVPIGKVKVFEKRGEKIPMGWGIDDNGIVTDDPKKVQSGGPGAVLPLGSTDILRSYKGYGLALLVDILCGALSGSATLTDVGFPHEPREADVGHFFMAIKIDAFRPVLDFKKQIDYMVGLLKDSPKAKGQNEIYIAGEKEYLAAEENKVKGVPLLDKIVEELKVNGADIGAPFDIKDI